jgi:hypothetical protein
MATKEEIMELVRVSLIGPILRYAESSLPEGQFRAYRRLVLDQFGGKGFGRELDKLFLNRKQPER